MSELFGGRTVHQLREEHLVADRGTPGRAIIELLDELVELRQTVSLTRRRTLNDGPCWCVAEPHGDKRWEHEHLCDEARAAVDWRSE